jgi:hypothetical protein
MNDQFEIDEVAVVANQAGAYAYLNGADALVTGPLQERHGVDLNTGEAVTYEAYTVEVDGQVFNAPPSDLRKKRPPVDLTTWATGKIKQLTKPINVPELEVV